MSNNDKGNFKCIYTFQVFRKSTIIACFGQKIACIIHFIYNLYTSTVI